MVLTPVMGRSMPELAREGKKYLDNGMIKVIAHEVYLVPRHSGKNYPETVCAPPN
jgi:hypothetical protein